MKNKKHIVIATYDGIGTYYCGVGTIAKNLVSGFSKLADTEDVRVSIAYINVDKESKIFNKQCYDDAKSLIVKTSGYLIPLCNNTLGKTEWDMWRSFPEWSITATSLATSLNMILKEDEENIVILNDTPFLVFAKYKEMINIKNVKYVYFPLSTGENHAFGFKDWRNSRIKLEKECFDLVKKDGNSKVISLGESFAKRMHDDYGLNFTKNDFLKNGLCFDKYNEFLSLESTNSDLKKFGINLTGEEKIVFAWGRCSVAKGFKELALAWTVCYLQLPSHHLVLQMPNNSGENDLFLEVKFILKNIPRVTIINDFNPNIWKTVLRNKNTEAVCIPSLMDPFPYTSIEAKLFSKGMNYITLISNLDGAVDAFDVSESLYVDPRNTKEFADKIVESITMDEKLRRDIINRNEITIEKFNFPKILKKFFEVNN